MKLLYGIIGKAKAETQLSTTSIFYVIKVWFYKANLDKDNWIVNLVVIMRPSEAR